MRPIAVLVDHLDAIYGNARCRHRICQNAGKGQLGRVVAHVDDGEPRCRRVERRMVFHLAADEAVDMFAQARGNDAAARARLGGNALNLAVEITPHARDLRKH